MSNYDQISESESRVILSTTRVCVSVSLISLLAVAFVVALQPPRDKSAVDRSQSFEVTDTSPPTTPLFSDIPKGTFVSTARQSCVEFTDDGTYFIGRNAFRFEEGRFRKSGSTLVIDNDGEEFQFELQGNKLIGQNGTEWVSRESALKTPGPDPSPLTIVVLDSVTKNPVTEFRYSYELETDLATYSPHLSRPATVKSAEGLISIIAPVACEIRIRIEGKDLTGGYGTLQTLVLTALNTKRRLEVLVERGVFVSGVVVDAATGTPVGNAIVSPIIFAPPLFVPDRYRFVETTQTGEFQLFGVDAQCGIGIRHEAYFDAEWSADFSSEQSEFKEVRIELHKGPSISGTVHDGSGNPLSEVKVSDGNGKEATTDTTGTFVLLSPAKSAFSDSNAYALSFEKNGYLDSEKNVSSEQVDHVTVVLKPLPLLTGMVTTEGGDSVQSFRLSAGSGREPRSWKCTNDTVNGDDRFAIAIRTDRDYGDEDVVWVGVRAEGFALWESVVPEFDTSRALQVQLKRGVSVTGFVSNREQHEGEIKAHLLPKRLQKEEATSETSQRQEMGRKQVSVNESGEFQFTHVASGQYILALGGDAVSPMSTLIEVSDSDVNTGLFSLSGTGTLSGIAYAKPCYGAGEPDKTPLVEEFADGVIYFSDSSGNSNENEFSHLQSISFKTDGYGQFRVENVPVGRASVNLPFWASADILESDTMLANIVEGETTVVQFFDPARKDIVRCRIIIGDGSELHRRTGSGLNASRKTGNVNTRDPMFKVDIEPVISEPGVFPNADWTTTKSSEITLSGVSPGRYQLIVGDWLGSIGWESELYRTEIEVADAPIDVTIPLGAGCITGSVQSQKESERMIHVIAKGRNHGTIRHARCDNDGNFCLRYLPPDVYQIYAHDPTAGWCSIQDAEVQDASVDTAPQTLRDGSSLRVEVSLATGYDQNVSIRASENGMAVDAIPPMNLEQSGCTFTQLWPGNWTITLQRDEVPIAARTVTLKGGEAVEVAFDP